MSTCRKMQGDPHLSPYTKLKFKWIKRPQHKFSHTEFIEKKVRSSLECMCTGDHFLNIIPEAKTLRATINKWDLLKLRSFCKAKITVNKTKQQPIEWEKFFTNPTLERGLISKIYKELKKLVIKRINNPIKNGVQT